METSFRNGILYFLLFTASNITFTLSGRARNRNKLIWLGIIAGINATIYYFGMKGIILAHMPNIYAIPFIGGSVMGAILGVKIANPIERISKSASDAYLIHELKTHIEALEEKIRQLEKQTPLQ